MRLVTWNMGCAPRQAARYRRSHAEAWNYLIEEFRPDVCFIQEALRPAPLPKDFHATWHTTESSESGTAILVANRFETRPLPISSAGSFLAGTDLVLNGQGMALISVHVGPPHYRRHLRSLVENLSSCLAGRSFVVAGDFNAARHLDDVQGGRWFRRFFEELSAKGFHDCHWSLHGREQQSFWGHQTKNQYQCDHVFVDAASGGRVSSCSIVDNSVVRSLSDHGPVLFELD